MHKILGDAAVGPEALTSMRERGGRWAAYQNIALDSAGLGHLQFIQYGPECTFKVAPEKCPDTQHGLGWKYAHVGYVDLAKGVVVELEQP